MRLFRKIWNEFDYIESIRNEADSRLESEIKGLKESVFGDENMFSGARWHSFLTGAKKHSMVDRIDKVEDKLNLLIEHLKLNIVDKRVKKFKSKKKKKKEDDRTQG